MSIKTFAEAEQVLAQTLPGYESRPQQQRLARFVEELLARDSGVGLAEAGCGVGKSLGSAIPAILSGKRTVMVTETLALMSQYAEKDIPFLEEHLQVPFTWALLKGRGNYFCWAKATDQGSQKHPELLADLTAELEANPDHEGSLDDFETPIDKSQWRDFSMSGMECPGKRQCPFGEQCLSEKAKTKARNADLVVTNAAMLMTDVKVRQVTGGQGSMLGGWEALIVDEAHGLEEVATNQLEEVFRSNGVTTLAKDVWSFGKSHGVDIDGGPLQRAGEAAWDVLPTPKEGERQRVGLSFFAVNLEPFAQLVDELRLVQDQVMSVTVPGDAKSQASRARLTTRISNMVARYEALVTESDDRLVRWIEMDRTERGASKNLHFAPIDVGQILKDYLWDVAPTVLVSATLSVGGDFSFVKERLGAQDATSVSVGTPFDYEKQALLFVPDRKVSSPKDRLAWQTYSQLATEQLIQSAGGGALLLFTSRSSMQASYDALAERMSDKGFTVLMQGRDGSTKQIVQAFKEDGHAVLFALKSFFTGVDIPGEALRLVVLDKLPFPVPSDPVFQARGDQIKKRGGSDFSKLSVPMMTLTMVQAYGRLIRTTQDRGVVAILDSRLTSTGWGQKIVSSLPDSPATTSLAEVKDFYQRARQEA